jgi:WD40 repeat protein
MGKLIDDLFCAADENKSIYVFKATDKDDLLVNYCNYKNLLGHTSLVSSLMFNNDDSELFSGSKGGIIFIWDLTTGKSTFFIFLS